MKIRSAEFKKSVRGTDDIIFEQRPQFAFIGRSNVGKSSLMNLLLDSKDLVKTGKTPGKTLELNFFLINHEFYFVDLPGYGYARVSPKDREQLSKMIQWYFFQKVFKRKAVLVLDVKAGPMEMDMEMLRILREHDQEVLVIVNKIDTLNQRELHERTQSIIAQLPDYEIIFCSAKTGDGKQEILKTLFEK